MFSCPTTSLCKIATYVRVPKGWRTSHIRPSVQLRYAATTRPCSQGGSLLYQMGQPVSKKTAQICLRGLRARPNRDSISRTRVLFSSSLGVNVHSSSSARLDEQVNSSSHSFASSMYPSNLRTALRLISNVLSQVAWMLHRLIERNNCNEIRFAALREWDRILAVTVNRTYILYWMCPVTVETFSNSLHIQLSGDSCNQFSWTFEVKEYWRDNSFIRKAGTYLSNINVRLQKKNVRMKQILRRISQSSKVGARAVQKKTGTWRPLWLNSHKPDFLSFAAFANEMHEHTSLLCTSGTSPYLPWYGMCTQKVAHPWRIGIKKIWLAHCYLDFRESRMV